MEQSVMSRVKRPAVPGLRAKPSRSGAHAMLTGRRSMTMLTAAVTKPETSQAEPSRMTTAGYELSADEAASLAKFTAAALPDEELLAILLSGVIKKQTDLQRLEGAILAAEQIHMGRLPSTGSLADKSHASARVTKMWQPIFASSGGFPRLLYIPVLELVDMSNSEAEQTLDIITELGPITTHFLGTCSWLSDTKVNYSIKQIRLDLLGLSGTFPMPAKLDNELTFFFVDGPLACARSKLGGTMLLLGDPESSKKYLQAGA